MNANSEEDEEESYVETTTNRMISETSQKSFPIPKTNKNEFNGKNFENCDYHVFFIFPTSMKK